MSHEPYTAVYSIQQYQVSGTIQHTAYSSVSTVRNYSSSYRSAQQDSYSQLRTAVDLTLKTELIRS